MPLYYGIYGPSHQCMSRVFLIFFFILFVFSLTRVSCHPHAALLDRRYRRQAKCCSRHTSLIVQGVSRSTSSVESEYLIRLRPFYGSYAQPPNEPARTHPTSISTLPTHIHETSAKHLAKAASSSEICIAKPIFALRFATSLLTLDPLLLFYVLFLFHGLRRVDSKRQKAIIYNKHVHARPSTTYSPFQVRVIPTQPPPAR